MSGGVGVAVSRNQNYGLRMVALGQIPCGGGWEQAVAVWSRGRSGTSKPATQSRTPGAQSRTPGAVPGQSEPGSRPLVAEQPSNGGVMGKSKRKILKKPASK